jgi:hypothetical protein
MPKGKKYLKSFLLILLLLDIGVFTFSHFQKSNLPKEQNIESLLLQDPVQEELDMEAFTIQKEDSTYTLNPKYTYDLWGLVVADYNSESWMDISHEYDPLNTKDLCTIWGENLSTSVYEQMKYSHGEWTCWAEFKPNTNSTWYEKFNPAQLSNNHLLPSNDEIYEEVKNTHIGDQVHLKGYLVDYSIETPDGKTGTRETSTIREDSGCEIIYVTEFEVLEKGNTQMLLLNTISKYLIPIFLILLIISIFLL